MEQETKMKVHGEDGYNKSCHNCGQFFWAEFRKKKYCTPACKQRKYRKRRSRKLILQSVLAKLGLGSLKSDSESVQKKKPDYARLTFILSFIGFLGSIGFYFGVLREVYSPARDKEQIEQLKEQNEQLQQTITILIEKEAATGG